MPRCPHGAEGEHAGHRRKGGNESVRRRARADPQRDREAVEDEAEEL